MKKHVLWLALAVAAFVGSTIYLLWPRVVATLPSAAPLSEKRFAPPLQKFDVTVSAPTSGEIVRGKPDALPGPAIDSPALQAQVKAISEALLLESAPRK